MAKNSQRLASRRFWCWVTRKSKPYRLANDLCANVLARQNDEGVLLVNENHLRFSKGVSRESQVGTLKLRLFSSSEWHRFVFVSQPPLPRSFEVCARLPFRPGSPLKESEFWYSKSTFWIGHEISLTCRYDLFVFSHSSEILSLIGRLTGSCCRLFPL